MDSKKNEIKENLDEILQTNNVPTAVRFILSALGSVPIAGGAIAGIGSTWSENDQKRINGIFQAWMKIQEEDLENIGKTLSEVMVRIDLNEDKTIERLQSKEYLSIIKKCFRDWTASDSEYKRKLLRNLLCNAAESTISTDDIVKLFIEWIGKYTEIHLKVIGILYKNDGFSRGEIWDELYGVQVREDSSEADLFKLVIHELSVGHVIRQFRPTDYNGNYIKQQSRKKVANTRYLQSAFEYDKPYVLTSLGKEFVHYTMNELVPKIEMKNV